MPISNNNPPHDFPIRGGRASPPGASDDEGGLRAPPGVRGWRKAWWWFHMVVLVKLARLRFIAILFAMGMVLSQWDALVSYYERWQPAASADAAAGDALEYFCPMHPTVIRNNNREKCPICFMPLSRRKKDEGASLALPPGIVQRIQLTPYRVALAGIQTWPVDFVPLAKTITTVGFVEFDERGQRTVSARAAGRIERLFANETGQIVQDGDPLALLYSPELLVTVQNLLEAKKSGGQEFLRASRTRLQLLGIDDPQIDEILATGRQPDHLTIRSPIAGHVINKYVREGQYVQEGTPLYDVADLSTVWIQAQLYEDDLAFLPEGVQRGVSLADGLNATATTRAYPNQSFEGRLAFVYPHVDQYTRTVTIRLEVDNPQHRLLPGSTAIVTLRIRPEDLGSELGELLDDHAREMLKAGRVLAVPESAVIDTGSQRIVYREAAPNVYEGVEVELGPAMETVEGVTFYPVRSGLAPRDRVVTAGSFLVDAETRLNPAAGSIYIGGGTSWKPSSSPLVRPSTRENPEATILASLEGLSREDRALAEVQRFCAVLTHSRLGSMGVPQKVQLNGEEVFLCCVGCKPAALAEPEETLRRAGMLRESESDPRADY